MSDCGCKDTGIITLGGKGSLLKLIRRDDKKEEKPVKSETIVHTPVVMIVDKEDKKPLSIEDEIEMKRLNFILGKIEQLRNVKKKSIFCEED